MKYDRENAKTIVPKRLKALRKATKLKQKPFADAVGISENSLKAYEQGRSIPETEALFKICNYCHCDIDYIFGRTTAKKRTVQDVMDLTGLSEKAVCNLMLAKTTQNTEYPLINSNMEKIKLAQSITLESLTLFFSIYSYMYPAQKYIDSDTVDIARVLILESIKSDLDRIAADITPRN